MKKTLLRLVLPLLLVVMMVTPMMSAFAEVTPAKEPITFTMFIAGPGEAPAKETTRSSRRFRNSQVSPSSLNIWWVT